MTDAVAWQGPVGDVWAAEWRRTDRAFGPISRALDAAVVAAARAGPFRALDIGCGAGATTLALAAVRPDAAILGIDLSPALIATARERASGQSGVAFETGDACMIAESQGPFDLIMSRHGVMFFPDPARAFGAFHGATAPGGALVFSCFAEPDANGFAAPLAKAVGLPPPVAGDAPGPFAFADPAHVAALLTEAGWRGARHERIDFPYRVGAGDAPLDDATAFLSRIGPAAAALRAADGERRAALRVGLRDYLADFERDGTVDLPAAAWLWSARA